MMMTIRRETGFRLALSAMVVWAAVRRRRERPELHREFMGRITLPVSSVLRSMLRTGLGYGFQADGGGGFHGGPELLSCEPGSMPTGEQTISMLDLAEKYGMKAQMMDAGITARRRVDSTGRRGVDSVVARDTPFAQSIVDAG